MNLQSYRAHLPLEVTEGCPGELSLLSDERSFYKHNLKNMELPRDGNQGYLCKFARK